LSLAANAAIGMGATRLCIGANQADHEDYPDCRPGFFATMGRALGIEILTPLINMSKRAIIIAATDRGLTREDAWSCYLGGPRACGSCPSCLEADQAWVTA
jgi:7-cyano-7-deazaguanine synthase